MEGGKKAAFGRKRIYLLAPVTRTVYTDVEPDSGGSIGEKAREIGAI